MKRSSFLHATTLTVLAFLTLTVCQAWAAVAINEPSGVAVDSKGNLYVANSGTNQILIYNTKYVQSKKIITAGVVHPMGVAFDSVGNLYVSNYGQTGLDSAVTVYDPTGKQLPGNTITDNVQFAFGIAVDSMNDVWVNNADSYVTAHSTYGTYLGTNNPGTLSAIATRGPWYVVATGTQAYLYSVGEVLHNFASVYNIFTGAGNITALGFDNTNRCYLYVSTGEVDLWNPASGISTFTQMGGDYQISSIAVDNAHGRVFLSTFNNSRIYVYSTSGQFITLIL